MSLEGRIFLPPLSRALRSPVIGRAIPCTTESAQCRQARGWCDETNSVQCASPMPSGASWLQNASVQQDDFPPNDWRRPTSFQRMPCRRDLGFAKPLFGFARQYRARGECRLSNSNTRTVRSEASARGGSFYADLPAGLSPVLPSSAIRSLAPAPKIAALKRPQVLSRSCHCRAIQSSIPAPTEHCRVPGNRPQLFQPLAEQIASLFAIRAVG